MIKEDAESIRRGLDKYLMERLAHFEDRVNEIEAMSADERLEIKLSLQKVLAWQVAHEDAMQYLQKLLSAGYSVKIIVMFIVGALAAIGAAAAAIEAVKKWAS